MHHGYSFSKAKPCELKRYKEHPKALIMFEHMGLLSLAVIFTIGCWVTLWLFPISS
jgi:hypothetical protein